jgi:hypothetical protein
MPGLDDSWLKFLLTVVIALLPSVYLFIKNQANKQEIELLKVRNTVMSDTTQVKKEDLVVSLAGQAKDLQDFKISALQEKIDFLNRIHELELRLATNHAETVPLLLDLKKDMTITKQQATLVNTQVTDMRNEAAINSGNFTAEQMEKTHAEHKEKDLAAQSIQSSN